MVENFFHSCDLSWLKQKDVLAFRMESTLTLNFIKSVCKFQLQLRQYLWSFLQHQAATIFITTVLSDIYAAGTHLSLGWNMLSFSNYVNSPKDNFKYHGKRHFNFQRKILRACRETELKLDSPLHACKCPRN